MTTARQPKGVPVGGQFAVTAHPEPGVALQPHGGSEQLTDVTAPLAHYDARWKTEKADLDAQTEAHTQRRRRLSGARMASRLLQDFPDAASMTYTRDPLNGLVTMESIEDANEYTLFDDSEMDGSAFGGSPEEARKKVAVRQSVRQLMGVTLPPDHTAQGITVQEASGTERIHLPTALEDGRRVLNAEDLTPEQSSAQRMDAALAGQAVEGNPGLSEATRQVHHSRRQLADAIKAVDESLLSAAIVHARQIRPGATEMRLRDNRARPGYLETSSLTTGDGEVIRDDGSYESWAFSTVEGADPGDIYDAITNVSQHSTIWDTDPRCEYDHRTREYIIYLDGRRRSEN